MTGLLISGRDVPLEGVEVVQHTFPYAYPRYGQLQQFIIHKTIADDPEVIRPGAGPPGGAMQTIKAWLDSGKPDGAALVVDDDGTLFQLCDLLWQITYHATVSNQLSIGMEIKEHVGGVSTMAAMQTGVKAILRSCRECGIQLQTHDWRKYVGHPIPRMIHGGRDMVGIFGHRDNTEQRGKWDPGDVIFQMLAAEGVEVFDFTIGEDLDAWKRRQQELNGEGFGPLIVDGIPGPSTLAALKRAGYVDGIYALGKAAA